ncbi:MAG: hypothetical protein HZA64_15545 [Rhodocyclales bacterium]|jgi:hypothetical protein|nr:hypothetical protein [Rhodocyclales bacterium]
MTVAEIGATGPIACSNAEDELMPVHSFVDGRHLLENGLRNYWGYNF